ncbi:MAG TPA: molybdopterin-dependent oxidoreductase [Dehalococcoidia bacterium]|nr:molybdopterin-dependent oxidoreductase [Dehalococcoidia bacterium]
MSEILPSLPHHPHPAIEVAGYAVRVDGLVGKSHALSLDALRILPQHELVDDFACIEGWVVPGLRWRGPRVDDVLALADAAHGAGWVQASAADFSTPLARANLSDALLALELGGEPLPVEHGGPVRLVVPGSVCYTSLKWLDRLEVCDSPDEDTARETALRRLGRDPG